MPDDPFQWARDYYNIQSQRAAQEQGDAQRSLMGVFTAEAQRQLPYSNLPVDMALKEQDYGHQLGITSVKDQYRRSLLDERDQKKIASMPAGKLFKLTTDSAKMFDVDPAAALALFSVESEFNPMAVSPTGATGLGQLTQGTASRMGVSDRRDPVQNATGSMRYYRYVADYLKQHGIEPSPANVYIGYQQGEGGAVALLRNPNARAGDVVDANNLRVNNIDPNMSAGQAAARISAKFRQRYTGYQAQLAKAAKERMTLPQISTTVEQAYPDAESPLDAQVEAEDAAEERRIIDYDPDEVNQYNQDALNGLTY